MSFIRPLQNGPVQAAVLDCLPDDGPEALKIMAQLTANMILSINDLTLEEYIIELRIEHAAYVAANKRAI